MTTWVTEATDHGGAIAFTEPARDAVATDLLIGWSADGRSVLLNIPSITAFLTIATAGTPGEPGLMSGPQASLLASLEPLAADIPSILGVAGAWNDGNGIPNVRVAVLAGGSPGSITGIGAAWSASGQPAPVTDDLIFGQYAGLLAVLQVRSAPGSDTSWTVLQVASSGGGGSGGVPEAPLDSIAYIRKNANWIYGVETVAGYTGIVTLELHDLADVDVITVPPVQGDVLSYDITAAKWFNLPLPFIIPEPPANGFAFARIGTVPAVPGVSPEVPGTWIEAALATHTHALNDLADVDDTAAVVGHFLQKQAGGYFFAAAPAGGASDLNGLTDVTLTALVEGQTLVYRGTQFVNEAPGGAGSSKLPINPTPLVGPVTHRIVAADAINQLSIDLSAGNVILEFDNTLTHGANERLVGLAMIEAVGAGSLSLSAASGGSTVTPPDEIDYFNAPTGTYRNNSALTIPSSGAASIDSGIASITHPILTDAILVLVVLLQHSRGFTYNNVLPDCVLDSTTLKPQLSVGPAAGYDNNITQPRICVAFKKLGNIAAGTKTAKMIIPGGFYCSCSPFAFIASSVNQAGLGYTDGGSAYYNGHSSNPVSFNDSIDPTDNNAAAFFIAAKSQNALATGAGDGWSLTGAGLATLYEFKANEVINASADTAATGIIGYGTVASGVQNATMAHTKTAKNTATLHFALPPLVTPGAPTMQIIAGSPINTLGQKMAWEYDRFAGKVFQVR